MGCIGWAEYTASVGLRFVRFLGRAARKPAKMVTGQFLPQRIGSLGLRIRSSEKGLVKRPFLVNGRGFSPTARISRDSWHFLKIHDLPGALDSEASYRRTGPHAGVEGQKSLRALKSSGRRG